MAETIAKTVILHWQRGMGVLTGVFIQQSEDGSTHMDHATLTLRDQGEEIAAFIDKAFGNPKG